MNNLSVGNNLLAKPTIGRSEYGRVKVALAPGKGFMDWLRLTTNKVLAKRQPGVDHIELAKHDKPDDCWVHLFGIVYDVTQYLDFHPGGIPELLRAAGRDATPLFNQYHAWVNYESMLKACVVGPFTGDLMKLKPCLPPTTSEDKNGRKTSSEGPSGYLSKSRVSFIKNGVLIEHDDWTGLTDDNVIVSMYDSSLDQPGTNDRTDQKIVVRIVVRHYWKPAIIFSFDPSPCDGIDKMEVKVEKNKVEVILPKLEENGNSDAKWKVFDNPEGTFYNKFEIDAISRINHDTLLFSINVPENIRYRIPVGHHVSVKIRKGKAVLYRLYTPIRSNCRNFLDLNASFDLMIKIYEDGVCTPSLEKLKIGDKIEISDPMGDKSYAEWIENAEELVLLAAGSGITPMIDVMQMRIEKTRDEKKKKTYLLIFNKTEKDIQTDESSIEYGWILAKWMQDFENDDQIVIRNVLSSPNQQNSGSAHLYGRITSDLLKSVIPSIVSPPRITPRRRAFACGPNGFLLAVRKSLEEVGIKKDDSHFFDG